MAAEVAAPASQETIFEQTLRDFQASLDEKQRRRFQSANFHDLETFLATIQKEQKSDRTVQNMKRLSGFLEAMKAYEEAMGIFVNVHQIVAFVWGPMKFLLEIARTHANAFNGLLEAYKRIGESLPLLEQFQNLFGTHEHMKKLLAELFRDIFEFQRRALHFFQRRNWKLLFDAFWKQFETDFGGIIEDIRQKKHLVATQASLVEYENAARERSRVNEQRAATYIHEQTQRRKYIMEWLAVLVQYNVDHERIRSVRQPFPASGHWLLRKARFQSWFTRQPANVPSLWITGRPGAGKSVLASLVIDEVSKLADALPIYFYCRQDDSEKNTFLAMARTMLHQLLVHDGTLSSVLFDAAYNRWEQTLSTVDLAEELLNKCLRSVGLTYVIVDGLDECLEAEQQHITKFLLQYVSHSSVNSEQSRYVFFSQDDQSTSRHLSELPTIIIEEPDCRADVAEYCRYQVQDIQKRFSLDDTEAMTLANTVALQSQGIFMLAKINMANLSLQTSNAALRAEFESDQLPNDLHAAYHRITCNLLKKAPTQYERNITRLLTFLACAVRPVKWREVQRALAVEDWLNSFPPDWNGKDEIVDTQQYQLVVGAKELCGALVEIVGTSDGEITLVLPSYKQYLVTSGMVNSEIAHASITELCLSYLSLWPFNADATDEQVENSALKGGYAFTEYALVGWVKHLELALRSSAERKTHEGAAATAEYIPQLADALEMFFQKHWKSPSKAGKLQKRYHGLLNVFGNDDLRTKLEQTIYSMQRFETSFVSDTEPYETLDIFKTVTRARLILERLASDAALTPLLQELYGPTLFKCTRSGCKWFHEGFTTLEERELHKDKHERAFKCIHEGCPYSKLGFVTEADLKKHEGSDEHVQPSEDEFFSEEDLDDDASSTGHSPHDADSTNMQTFASGNEAKYAPDEHPSERSRHFRDHCSTCSKSFTSRRARKRHEKGHSGETASRCNACNRSSIRREALHRHKLTGQSAGRNPTHKRVGAA